METNGKPQNPNEVLDRVDLQREYGFAREVARGLILALPHAKIGNRRVIRREDIEHLVKRATLEGIDLRQLALTALARLAKAA